MKLYIKYMVSTRCKIAVKEELKKLGLHFIVVDLGEVEIMETLSTEQMSQLKAALLVSGLGFVLIGFFTMIARQKAVTQMIAFLVMENGLFLGATAATYGMPLIVELGVFFDVLVAALIAGIYTNRLQDAFDSVDTSHLSELKE